jgi:hypothetical protein
MRMSSYLNVGYFGMSIQLNVGYSGIFIFSLGASTSSRSVQSDMGT